MMRTSRPVQVAWMGGMSATEPDVQGVGPERFGGLRAAGDVGELHVDARQLLVQAGQFQCHLDAGITHGDGGAGRDRCCQRRERHPLSGQVTGGGGAAAGSQESDGGNRQERGEGAPAGQRAPGNTQRRRGRWEGHGGPFGDGGGDEGWKFGSRTRGTAGFRVRQTRPAGNRAVPDRAGYELRRPWRWFRNVPGPGGRPGKPEKRTAGERSARSGAACCRACLRCRAGLACWVCLLDLLRQVCSAGFASGTAAGGSGRPGRPVRRRSGGRIHSVPAARGQQTPRLLTVAGEQPGTRQQGAEKRRGVAAAMCGGAGAWHPVLLVASVIPVPVGTGCSNT